jgi:hypothetical protein
MPCPIAPPAEAMAIEKPAASATQFVVEAAAPPPPCANAAGATSTTAITAIRNNAHFLIVFSL